jgi:hypothetical protein
LAPFLFLLEGGREPEQPGGVHLTHAADPPSTDIQVYFTAFKKIINAI